MARELEYARITLARRKNERGNFENVVEKVDFSIKDMAQAKKFDQRKVATIIPGLTITQAKIDAVINELLVAIRNEATLP